MKPLSFENYKSKPDEFKKAQPREGKPFTLYQPKPHPFADRIKEARAIPSLWTQSKRAGT